MLNFITTNAEVQLWVSQGLPADSHSVQNGMLTENATRFALCIDPQMQAVKWIKNKSGKNLVVKTFNDSDFVRHLELSVQYGKHYLLESINEDLDPVIDPILERLTFTENDLTFERD